MFAVPIDRTQQRVDVDERALGESGQNLDTICEFNNVVTQHRFELSIVPKGQLAH